MRSYRYVCLLLLSCIIAVEARRKKSELQDEIEEYLDVPSVHPLVEMIGKAMYDAINCAKYKFYIYMVWGSLPDEASTIAVLSTFCNVLYGCSVFFGFIFFPRDRMLLATLLTIYVGPAMILILLGAIAGTIVAFALYPIYSVLAIWLWFFLTSQMAQALGRYLGLDHDGDGDVDMLDLLHWVASTRLGSHLGLLGLYNMLNNLNPDPFQKIHQRLDDLTESISGPAPNIKTEEETPPIKKRLRKKGD